MTIDDLLMEIEQGVPFSIDLKNRRVKLGKTRYDITKDNIEIANYSTNEVLNELEDLYRDYKYSLPSERSEEKRRKYFYAVPIDSLSIEQMCTGISREIAQAKLELWLLFNIVAENLKWTDSLGKWYWHGTDKDLIILKGWC